MSQKYSNYFSVDENYFPQINPSSIVADPESWRRTFPHATFLEMLEIIERALARQMPLRSLWIEGAYGTGKSQCAYALKKILDVPEEELRSYWEKFDELKSRSDLLEKLLGHKESGIVTIHRYASGNINSFRQFCFEIQESVKKKLSDLNLYDGMNTLKEGVIAWMAVDVNKNYINSLLKTNYSAYFSQSNADEIIVSLRQGGNIRQLLDGLFRLADDMGIRMLEINADLLISWLKDVIDQNKIKLVFIWDEFSDYFRNNMASLSDFQKLVEIVAETSFYFVPVTHESGQMFNPNDESSNKIQSRFKFNTIRLPDNIAFDLIGHAFKETQIETIREIWDAVTDDLNSQINNSRDAVMKVTKIQNANTIKKILPLHPMAALVLKHIATSFQSNQRSMFDFIKNSDPKLRAFQWFIENSGPTDDPPLLSVDMLWHFFYEQGRSGLAPNIQMILDVFPQQKHLTPEEERVLKAILILQAIDTQLAGALEIFKATDKHLSYVFEGISGLEETCLNIARKLKRDGVLMSRPQSGGQEYYTAAVLAGDQSKIEHFKDELTTTSTEKLVTAGELGDVLQLSSPLKLRFELMPGKGNLTTVTKGSFKRDLNRMQNTIGSDKFKAVIAFAKDENEAILFRKEVKEKAADPEYEDVLFIDALGTPLGHEAFEKWVDEAALANYHQGSNASVATEHDRRANAILTSKWKNKIMDNALILYSADNPEGERHANADSVRRALQTHVTKFQEKKAGFSCSFEFNHGLTDSQFKMSNLPMSAQCGIEQQTKGVVSQIEKHTAAEVWKVERYWEQEHLKTLPICRIKKSLELVIQTAFDRDGQIAIGDIYTHLKDSYGFVPSNLHAFLMGFLLSEYGNESYRFADAQGGSGPLEADYLAKMIANCLNNKNTRSSFIVKMTPDEMAFFDLCEQAWGVPADSCNSAGDAGLRIKEKMRTLKLPLWTLREVVDGDLIDPINTFMELVQKEGKEAHGQAIKLGSLVSALPELGKRLAAVLTVEKCQEGMRKFLESFEGGRLPALAAAIGAESALLGDIRQRFEAVQHSSLWTKELGEEEIRKVLVDYSVVQESNKLLSGSKSSRGEIMQAWRERLSFFRLSHEVVSDNNPVLSPAVSLLLKIFKNEELLPNEMLTLQEALTEKYEELKNLLDNEKKLFAEAYRVYLEELSEEDIEQLRLKLPQSMFALSRTESNQEIKHKAEEYKKSLKKTQLVTLWEKKTGTRNPNEWSRRYKTPILCCVEDGEFKRAKKCFDTLNSPQATERDINDALAYLKEGSVFRSLENEKSFTASFVDHFIGKYRKLLPDTDSVRKKLEQMDPDIYQWYDHPSIKNRIEELAQAAYFAGGSDQAVAKIDAMDAERLKEYLKRLVKDNVTVGLEIIDSEGQ